MGRRVLFTASTYSHIVNFHLPYLKAFGDRGWEVEVACGGAPMDIPFARRVIHIPFEKSMLSPQNGRAVRLLRGEMSRRRYELVSCHTALAAFFTRLAVYGLKDRPAVCCTAHGYLFDEKMPAARRLLLEGAEGLTAPVTDLLMVMNRWDEEFARRRRLGRQVVSIPGMGVDFGRLKRVEPADAAALRQEWGFGPEQFLLVYGAEFSRRKSQEVLLRALAQLPEQVGLLLPGDGALREECIRLSRELGLGGRVAFPGQVGNMALWYAAADAAVSASRIEGLPFHLMEAMYCGLPVVASAVKGHEDLVLPEETGLLYPYGDAAACAACIRRLAEAPELARQMGRAGARSVERYELSLVLPQVLAAYERLLPLGEPQAEPVG